MEVHTYYVFIQTQWILFSTNFMKEYAEAT